MIGKLSGIIDSFDIGHLILDVNGVGYVVNASSRTLAQIGSVGDAVSILIITQVREDAITLFGFADAIEQQWFKLLTSVQGVGAKAGLAILAVCPADNLSYVIASQDKAALTQADGVGPKLATRILTELKDKVSGMEFGSSSAHSSGGTVQPSGIDQDAVSALTNLGYGSADAFRAVQANKDKANDNLQTLIRLALQELSA